MQRSSTAPRAGDRAAAGAHRAAAFRELAAELTAAAKAVLAAEGGPLAGLSADRNPGPASGEPSAGVTRAEDQEQKAEEAAVEGGAPGTGVAVGGRLIADGAGVAAAARWLVACADPGYAHSLELCGRWAQALEQRHSCSLPLL